MKRLEGWDSKYVNGSYFGAIKQTVCVEIFVKPYWGIARYKEKYIHANFF
jgi:hypothetical protein